MKERIFIKKAKEQVALEDFLRHEFRDAKCGLIDVQHTPIMTRVVIYTTTPGIIIGSGGEKIKETMEVLKEKFHIENPQIDVQKIDYPDLDPHIIAQSIANSLENNVNYKKLGNFYVEKILGAGALGCELILTGKIGGQRGRRERFTAGYIKKCGDTARKNVVEGFAVANPKLGNIGVHVKIMTKSLTFLVKPKLKKVEEDIKPEIKQEAKNDSGIDNSKKVSESDQKAEPVETKIDVVEKRSEQESEVVEQKTDSGIDNSKKVSESDQKAE